MRRLEASRVALVLAFVDTANRPTSRRTRTEKFFRENVRGSIDRFVAMQRGDWRRYTRTSSKCPRGTEARKSARSESRHLVRSTRSRSLWFYPVFVRCLFTERYGESKKRAHFLCLRESISQYSKTLSTWNRACSTVVPWKNLRSRVPRLRDTRIICVRGCSIKARKEKKEETWWHFHRAIVVCIGRCARHFARNRIFQFLRDEKIASLFRVCDR